MVVGLVEPYDGFDLKRLDPEESTTGAMDNSADQS